MNPYESPKDEAVWAEIVEPRRQSSWFVPYLWWGTAFLLSAMLFPIDAQLADTAATVTVWGGMVVCAVIEARKLLTSYGFWG